MASRLEKLSKSADSNIYKRRELDMIKEGLSKDIEISTEVLDISLMDDDVLNAVRELNGTLNAENAVNESKINENQNERGQLVDEGSDYSGTLKSNIEKAEAMGDQFGGHNKKYIESAERRIDQIDEILDKLEEEPKRRRLSSHDVNSFYISGMENIDLTIEIYKKELLDRGVEDGEWLNNFLLSQKAAMQRQLSNDLDAAAGNAKPEKFYTEPDYRTFYDLAYQDYLKHRIGKEPKKPMLKNANNFNKLEDYLGSLYDIKMDKLVKKLNFDIVKEAICGVEAVINDFPSIGETLNNAAVSKSGIMSCNGNTVSFNPNYFKNKQTIYDTCKEQSAIGNWIPNSSPASIGAHEAAHGVEWALISANSSYKNESEKIIAWNTCVEAASIVDQACKNIQKTDYGKGKNQTELIKSVSKYALRNDSEAMAEAFADVFANGSNANQLSIEIRRLALEKIKKYKGG